MDGYSRCCAVRELPQQLKTRRTVLRRIRLSDAAGWKSFNNAIARRMPEWPAVPSVVYARNEMLHYDRMWDAGTRYVYAILERSTGKVIGDFHVKALDRKRGKAEFGHALHPRVWGTGITYETLEVVRKAAKRAGLRLWCKIEEDNVRSWKSIEKYGAKLKAKRVMRIGKQRKMMRVYDLW